MLACTKADLLPRGASPARLEQWVRRRAKVGGLTVLDSVKFVGAPTRFGVSSLAITLEELSRQRSGAEVWVIGAQNAGKSSLINALSTHYYGAAFKAGPVASHVPGTTLGLVRLEALLPGKRTVIDTPGLLHAHQITPRLTPDEARLVLPRRPLRPRTFRVPLESSVSVGGLFRIDVLDGPSSTLYLTTWVSEDVPTHMGRTSSADDFFYKHAGAALKPPLVRARRWLRAGACACALTRAHLRLRATERRPRGGAGALGVAHGDAEGQQLDGVHGGRGCGRRGVGGRGVRRGRHAARLVLRGRRRHRAPRAAARLCARAGDAGLRL